MTPKVSIITVCFNAESLIEDTIKSVVEQEYKNYEYIIIDGKSTDNTINIISKYSKYIAKLVSEKDNGIYDAMNKSLNYVSEDSDYLIFINAGDLLLGDALSSIFDNYEAKQKQNFNIYGDFFYGDDLRILPSKLGMGFLARNTVCHQALIFNTSIHKEYKYNLNYPICADYEVILKMYKDKINFKKIDVPIVKYLPDGFSDLNKEKLIKERISILYQLNKKYLVLYLFHLIVIESIFKLPLKNKFIKKMYKSIKGKM